MACTAKAQLNLLWYRLIINGKTLICLGFRFQSRQAKHQTDGLGWGMTSTSSGWLSTNDFGHFGNYTRRDDVLPTMSTNKGTSNTTDASGSDNENSLILEPGVGGSKITLFFEPLLIPTKPKDGERGEDPNEDPRFRAYLPSIHIHNVDLLKNDGMEFAELLQRRLGHISSTLDSGDLEVAKEFVEHSIRLVHIDGNVQYQWHFHVVDVWIHKVFFKDAFFNCQIFIRSFPYYDQLTSLYAKDRDTGKDAQTTIDIAKEIDVENVATAKNPKERSNDHRCEANVSLDKMHILTTQAQLSKLNRYDSIFSKKKKKRFLM
ncbi:hypothetical protein J1N35_022144 [Gossypium stocksii]|uniref:Uncharacterized protein n=1 Tax=Gossypium stocksii TaxID=47602 RepID=A0A9D3VG65_9ROSI|nr:hypothetical protein J1N35_022144 [Gossypium stocksii]